MAASAPARILRLLLAGFVWVAPVQAQEELSALDSLLSIPIHAAARYEQTAREAPASISIITREDIEGYGFRSLSEALSTLQGFHRTQSWSDDFLGVRGFARPSSQNNRILLLVDGRKWNDLHSAHAILSEGFGIPMELIERIEVVRGPGSALYGSSAMLAVVNVVTIRGGASTGRVVTGEGGTDRWGRALASYSGRLGDMAVSAFARAFQVEGPDLYFPEFDGATSDGWVRDRAYYDSYAARVTAAWSGLELTLLTDGGERGDPTAPYGSSFGATDTYQYGSRRTAALHYDAQPSASLGVTVDAAYHHMGVDAPLAFDDPAPNRVVELSGGYWIAEGHARYDVSPSNRVVLGVEHQRQDPRMRVGVVSEPLREKGRVTHLVSAFAQSEWQLSNELALVAGARVDHYSTVGSAFSPRGALVYHPKESSTVKLLYGSAFRAPSNQEQFIEEPPFLFENPDLGPERIRTVELVVEQTFGSSVRLTASAHDYRIADLIVLGLQPDGPGLTYLNTDRAYGRGVGAEIAVRPGRGLSVFTSAFWNDTHSRPDHERVANSPSLLLRAGATTRLSGGSRVGLMASWEGERRTVHGGTTDGHAVLDGTVRSPRIGPLEIVLTARNLLGTEYFHPAGSEHRQQSFPQPGRSFRIAVSGAF